MFDALKTFTPPSSWRRLTTLDYHTAGEPLRIVTGGYPDLPGDDMLARRRYAAAHLDRLRTALLWEPRGHREMYGCILTPPVRADSHFGALFMHNEGYSTMCGHAVIALGKAAVETGLVPAAEPVTTVRIDTPAGTVTAFARVSAGRVTSVSFHNVPSFVVELDAGVDVPGFGRVRYDLAFGGAFYAYVPVAAVGLRLVPEDHQRLIEAGMAVKRAVTASRRIAHPFDEDLGFLYGVIFTGPPEDAGAHSRNVCIFAEGQVDRSPTGTGVSGRAALAHARGEMAAGDERIVESILGTRFTVRITRVTRFGPYPAVIPEVEGRAHLTGRHTFFLDPDDDLGAGFFMG
jgi:trans-L-3-hydroxyproline dehydratase